jgi:hypothetical protein
VSILGLTREDDASGHDSQVPTRDQPREACQARCGRNTRLRPDRRIAEATALL